MSHEGYALQLLRACNVSPTQMIQFLQPFQGRLPTTEQEFLVLQTHMRCPVTFSSTRLTTLGNCSGGADRH
eukprot:5844837-Alexandrium_andersonii.AAC.1